MSRAVSVISCSLFVALLPLVPAVAQAHETTAPERSVMVTMVLLKVD